MRYFLVNGFKTTGSCEGHIDRGLPYPWIDISHEIEDVEFRKKSKDIFDEINLKAYKSEEDLKENNIILYNKLKDLEIKINSNKEDIRLKIENLLNEFYENYTSAYPDSRLCIVEAPTEFRIEPVSGRKIGLDNWKKFDDKVSLMSLEEKEEYLKNNQEEMNIFTTNLKNKF